MATEATPCTTVGIISMIDVIAKTVKLITAMVVEELFVVKSGNRQKFLLNGVL